MRVQTFSPSELFSMNYFVENCRSPENMMKRECTPSVTNSLILAAWNPSFVRNFVKLYSKHWKKRLMNVTSLSMRCRMI